MRRKPSTVEATRSPVCWKPGQQTQTWQKLTHLSLRFQKTSSWGRNSSLLWLEGHMTNKILIPLQSLVSCFLKPPVSRRVAVGTTEGSGSGYLVAVAQGG